MLVNSLFRSHCPAAGTVPNFAVLLGICELLKSDINKYIVALEKLDQGASAWGS